MDKITSFLETNLNVYLLCIIVLGGIFIVKYTKDYTRIKNVYKVLIASILFSVIFYFTDECRGECIQQYFFTYLTATSFYELIVKWIIERLKIIFPTAKKE